MKIYKYLFLLIIGLSAIGCSDLKEEPIGVLSPDGFFQSTNDIQTAVNGSFTAAINEQFWGRKLAIALMLRSDMVALNSGQDYRAQHDDLTTLTDNAMITAFWLKTYQGIAAANLAIAGAEDVDVDEETKNPVIAQAYFARAFYYFHLVRQFGAIPYLSEPVTDAEAMATISRTPASEVYDHIIADLEYAKEWLPPTQVSRAIPSKGAASSYLALVYLTMAGNESGSPYWAMAYNEAEEVIANKGTYNYDLDPDFQTLFNADKIDSSLEPIFAIDYNHVEADNNGYDQLAPMCGIRGDEKWDGGWSVASPKLPVYQSFIEGDYRRAVSFDTDANVSDGSQYVYVDYTNFTISGHGDARNTPYIAKYGRYPGEYARANARATSHNYSMLRYAEVLLIAAEAGIESGLGAGKALTYVNLLRERARKGGSTKTGAEVSYTFPASDIPADLSSITVEDVLEERRMELAFECVRWYDIARRQLGPQVYGASGYEGAKPGFDANDYLMPIPSEEIDRNPNLLPNNPGY